jgi:hypothetical protein
MTARQFDFIVEREGGQMHCDACNENNCYHVYKYILSPEEPEQIWKFLNSIQAEETNLFEVPISPDVPTLWNLVMLIRSEIPNAWKVCEAKSSEFLGFLHEGEGRATMSMLLDNWLYVKSLKINIKSCIEPTHSFEAQVRLEHNLETPKGRRLESWSQVLYNHCLYCHLKHGSDDFSDLVPDVGSGKKVF